MALRLYVETPLRTGLAFDLPPGPARHVQVRRAQPGDVLHLFDGAGGEWTAEVLQMGRQQVSVRVHSHEAVDREPALAVTLALGMPANDRMDFLVEKATELGVAIIQPLVTERSVLRLDGERAARKQAHWQGIAIAAAEQSGRTRLPVIEPVRALPGWLAGLAAEGPRWLLSPVATTLPARPVRGALVALSGPEGGLSPNEEALARGQGFDDASLGPRVLRADTAPLALLAALTLPQ